MRVAVIGTIHEAIGTANLPALETLLHKVRPEVIFLEMPPSALEDFANGARVNLESAAVDRFLARYSAELVAVDLPTPEASFFRQSEELWSALRSRSPHYFRLKSLELKYVREQGYQYLNSDHYASLLSELHDVCLSSLADIGEERLVNIYDRFNSANELRDEAMLSNIEAYCRSSERQRGAFLVGAAHVPSLRVKSGGHLGSLDRPIHWDFESVV